MKKIEETKSQLLELIKEDSEIVVVLHSASKSGMSRKMSAYVIKDNKLINLNLFVERLGICKRDKNGHLIVQGCGMDMAFWLADAIKSELYGCDIANENQQYRII